MSIALSGNNTAVAFNVLGNPVSIPLTAEPAGNTIVLWFCWRSSIRASTITSITCANVTFTLLGSVVSGTNTQVIYVGTVSGGNSGTAVAVSFSNTATVTGTLTGFSGVAITSPIDGVTQTAAVLTGATVTAPAFTVVTSGGMLLTAITASSNVTTNTSLPAAPWTNQTKTNNGTTVCQFSAYSFPDSVGSAPAAQWKFSVSTNQFQGIIGAVKAQPAAPFVPPVILRPGNGSVCVLPKPRLRINRRK